LRCFSQPEKHGNLRIWTHLLVGLKNPAASVRIEDNLDYRIASKELHVDMAWLRLDNLL